MDYVGFIIWAYQLLVGMQCLTWQKLSLKLFQILTCKRMRGGAFYISKSYGKANKKYLKCCDSKQE